MKYSSLTNYTVSGKKEATSILKSRESKNNATLLFIITYYNQKLNYVIHFSPCCTSVP